jgi:hypothetical protein
MPLCALILLVLSLAASSANAHKLRKVGVRRLRGGSGASHVFSDAVAKRMQFEAKSQAHLEAWCNRTLPAVTGRRAAVEQLLSATQSAGEKADFSAVQLQQAAASLSDAIERQRVTAEASHGARQRKATLAKLGAEDASMEEASLKTALKHFGKPVGSDKGSQLLQKLLDTAESAVKRHGSQQLMLLQVSTKTSETSEAKEKARLQGEYESKQEELARLRNQHYSSARSLGVLTAALEDESAYLVEVQELCSIRQAVQKRTESRLLPRLNKAAAEVGDNAATTAASPMAAVTVPIEVTTAVPASPLVAFARAVAPTLAPAALPVATATPTVAPVAQTAAPAVVAAPVTTTAAPSPLDDLDEDEALFTSMAPVAVVKKEKHVSAAPPAKPHSRKVSKKPSTSTAHSAVKAGTASMSQQQPAAPAVPAVPATTPPPAQPAVSAPHPKKHPHSKKKKKDDVQEAIDAATTTLPAAFNIWRPGGPSVKVDDASVHTRHDITAGGAGSPASRMKAMFGDDDSTAAASPIQVLADPSIKVVVDTTVAPGVDDSAVAAAAAALDPDAADTPVTTTVKPVVATTTAAAATVAAAPAQPTTVVAVSVVASTDDAVTVAPTSQDSDADSASNDNEAPAVAPPPPTPPVQKPQQVHKKKHHNPAPAAAALVQSSTQDSTDASSSDGSSSNDATTITTITTSTNSPAVAAAAAALDPGSQDDDQSQASASPTDTGLPKQYNSFTPASRATVVDPRSDPKIASWVQDFETDEQAPTTTLAPAHHRKGKHHHKKGHKEVVKTTAAPDDDEDDKNIVYDDDDLPKHHEIPINIQFQGWRSLLSKVKKPIAKPDATVLLMQNLYANNGAMPKSYKPWKPHSAQAAPDPDAASSAPPSDGGDDGGDDDGKGDDDNGDDAGALLQVSAHRRAVHRAASPLFAVAALLQQFSEDSRSDDEGAAADETTAAPKKAAPVASTTVAPAHSTAPPKPLSEAESRTNAAVFLLQAFADKLKSHTLQQLAEHKDLSPLVLNASLKHLRAADEIVHPVKAPVTPSKAGRTELMQQWCSYFQSHAGSAEPLHKANADVEKASDSVAEVDAKNAALVEETEARSQFQKAVAQDLTSLTSLLASEKEGLESSGLDAFPAAEAAIEGLQDAHAELADTLQAVIRQRSTAGEAQKTALAQLESATQESQDELSAKKAQAAKKQASLEQARKQVDGIRSSCDVALVSVERHRHTSHLEVRAVEMALTILSSK